MGRPPPSYFEALNESLTSPSRRNNPKRNPIAICLSISCTLFGISFIAAIIYFALRKPRSSETCPTCQSVNQSTSLAPQLQCSFEYVDIGKYGAPTYLNEACFPDGPLKVGDSIIIEGIQPPCCPPPEAGSNIWSLNFLARTKAPLVHMAVRHTWEEIAFTRAPNGWGSWETPVNYTCPLKPNTQFKIKITNKVAHLEFIINQKTFTYEHVVKNPEYIYHSIGLAINRDFKTWNVTVIRNGVEKAIGLGSIDFSAKPA